MPPLVVRNRKKKKKEERDHRNANNNNEYDNSSILCLIYTIARQSTRIFAEYQRKKILRTPWKVITGKHIDFQGKKTYVTQPLSQNKRGFIVFVM